MATFYLTFPLHPRGRRNKYQRIEAQTKEQAQHRAFQMYGYNWEAVYNEADFAPYLKRGDLSELIDDPTGAQS
jgi:hypothetical protein